MNKIILSVLLIAHAVLATAQDNSASNTVKALYQSISFEPGKPPKWPEVRKFFLEEAIITLRASKDRVNVFTVDQWVQDFVDFIEIRELTNVGFNERIAAMKTFEYGDMAQVLVLYEPRIPGIESDRQGIDSIHLIKRAGQWKIVSILNELPTKDRPVPEFD